MVSFHKAERKLTYSRKMKMPNKISKDMSYGGKLIRLFSTLLFSKRSYSLTELSELLECSKQTVSRLVNDISANYDIPIQEELIGNRKYYQISRPKWTSVPIPVSPIELSTLQMCRAFTECLMGKEQFATAASAIWKSSSLVVEGEIPSEQFYSTLKPGTIDYTPHQTIIRNIIEAMEDRRICKINYQRVMSNQPKLLYIKPMKLFSHRDSIYLHAHLARSPGKPFKEPTFNPILAIHRILALEPTDRKFQIPSNYDFEKDLNDYFGVIKSDPFTVELKCKGWAAKFVAERIWSPDQILNHIGDGNIELSFSASSKPEVLGLILWLGPDAILVKPQWLVNELKLHLSRISANYRIR